MAKKKSLSLSFLLIGAFFLFTISTKLFPDILWFRSFGFEHIWWFVFKTKAGVFAGGFIVAFIFLYIQYLLSQKLTRNFQDNVSYHFNTPFNQLNQFLADWVVMRSNTPKLPQKIYDSTLKLVILGLSVVFGLIAKSEWQEFYAFMNQVPYGKLDPIFNKDISFYLFSLPFFQDIQGWALGVSIVSFLFITWVYFSKNIIAMIFSREKLGGHIRSHLFIVLSIICLLFSVGAWLDMYNIMFSTNGVVFGAGYADHKFVLPATKALAFAFALQSIIFFVSAFTKGVRMVFVGLGLILIVSIGGIHILPGVVHNFLVAPNELRKETPYIKHNIEYSRLSYNLSNIESRAFPANTNLTSDDMMQNKTTMNNIRLWNQEPLKQTFSQLQEIRLYYEFLDIDVDRYRINGDLRQVMLSPRELDSTKLSQQAQTWINQRLTYTHGFGVCMSPVSEISTEGLPNFYLKDLPPKSTVPDLNITRPEIYFGEKTNDYIIVNTKQKEFDYPKGDTNKYTSYAGNGGIVLDSFVKRILFSLKYSDIKIFLSSLITNESRLMFDRDIHTIPRKIAPFLVFDQDPYLVVTEQGRLVWMYDAYTLSDKFPYAERYSGRINYIRNSVKVTIDAYDGETHFYVADTSDPIIKTYEKIYDNLFEPLTDMPSDLQEHIRYPKDLFSVQTRMFSTYHMTDPQVFYNKEDLWTTPQETYGESEQVMKPYYTVTKLPGDKKESFILMLPFTPTNKNNMIAWMSVKCDPDEYGKLQVYKFPKERTIYGPMQIESRIDQDTMISQKLTLWGQSGSRVIRGNIIVVPIKDSIVYVEPIYLQATQSKFPELKRVILGYGDKIIMAQNLTEATQKMFGSDYHMNDDNISDKQSNQHSDTVLSGTIVNRIIQTYKAMKNRAKNLQWTEFGSSMDELDGLIETLEKKQPITQ